MNKARHLVWLMAPCALLSDCVADVRLGPEPSEDAGSTTDAHATGGKSGSAGADAPFDVVSAGQGGADSGPGSGGSTGSGGQSQCSVTPTPGTTSVALSGQMVAAGGSGGGSGGGSAAAPPMSGQAIVVWVSDIAAGSDSYLWGK